jgi:hypothetical protein
MKKLFLVSLMMLAGSAWAENQITLACLADNPSELAGVEFQYQINEKNKTVLATRGEQPSQIYIDSIRVLFAQGQAQTSISRSTGRFSVVQGGELVVTGSCQLIKQPKF